MNKGRGSRNKKPMAEEDTKCNRLLTGGWNKNGRDFSPRLFGRDRTARWFSFSEGLERLGNWVLLLITFWHKT